MPCLRFCSPRNPANANEETVMEESLCVMLPVNFSPSSYTRFEPFIFISFPYFFSSDFFLVKNFYLNMKLKCIVVTFVETLLSCL